MNSVSWFILYVVTANQLLSPFADTLPQDYLDNFINVVEELQQLSQETIFEDQTFDSSKYDLQAAVEDAQTYDFIVIGAGTAGSVIASRLSEVPEWTILLLEAGDVESPYAQIPAIATSLQATNYNWGYLTEPQDTWCLGMVDRKCALATGKGMGGGSAMDGTLYTRGNARDYDLWADQGNKGWSYNDVLPYFKKVEDSSLNEFDYKFHNQGGPLHVEDPQYLATPLQETFIAAGKELGYKVIDYNGKEQIGFAKTQMATKHGTRNSAAKAYLLPYKNRKNLHIKPLSHVIHIIIHCRTKEAVGVKYVHNDTLFVAKANKEVILSAGPFNSAQLLMLSGVGPKEDLEKLNIRVLSNLQVGRQVKDHIDFLGVNVFLNVSKLKTNSREQIETWLKYKHGPLSSVGLDAIAFIKTKASKDQAPYPDVEIFLGGIFGTFHRLRDEYLSVVVPQSKYLSCRIEIMPTHPKSVGTIKLKSNDPFHAPLIDLNQLSDPEGHDIETMVAGIKKSVELIQTKAFQKLGAQLSSETFKECEHFEFASDDYWKCAVRYFSITLRHQTGACKMGPRSDKYAVVDNELRVYGINKLRVADTSIIPVSITGHTYAPTNMVGEKAADLIKQYWM